jgi:hypothetical protein
VPAASPADRMASASVAARRMKVTVSLSVPTDRALCRSYRPPRSARSRSSIIWRSSCRAWSTWPGAWPGLQLSATRALYRGPEGSGGDLFGCSGTVGTARLSLGTPVSVRNQPVRRSCRPSHPQRVAPTASARRHVRNIDVALATIVVSPRRSVPARGFRRAPLRPGQRDACSDFDARVELAEAGRKARERFVDGEQRRGGEVFGGDPLREGNLDRPWAPDRVCTSSTAARRSRGNRSATRTRAGQTRRWSKVIFPSTRRVATTSGESRTRVSTAKISWPDGCPHQLPRIGPPTICSARFGTGPRADCNTTPCSHTQSSGSTNPIQTRDLASATPASARGAAKRVDAERRWTRTYLPRDSCASPNGLPSESLQIAHAFPGWTTLPPSASTRSTALVRSLTAK